MVGTEVTVSISSNGVSDSNDENNFSNKLLLTKCTSFKASKSLWKKFKANNLIIVYQKIKCIKYYHQEDF